MNDVQKEIIARFYQKRANAIARKAGYQKATKIIFGNEDKVVDRTPPGYRKKTTGEYVSKSYMRNFGWKNTYYCYAETVVTIKK